MRRENELFFPLVIHNKKWGKQKKKLMSFSLRIAAHYKRIFYKPDADRISATTQLLLVFQDDIKRCTGAVQVGFLFGYLREDCEKRIIIIRTWRYDCFFQRAAQFTLRRLSGRAELTKTDYRPIIELMMMGFDDYCADLYLTTASKYNLMGEKRIQQVEKEEKISSSFNCSEKE